MNSDERQPRFESAPARFFTGRKVEMSFSQNKTSELWRGFMPEREKVAGRLGGELYSIEVYPSAFFDDFDPARKFEKWAAVEVSEAGSPPPGMELLAVPAGLYAVFVYRGRSGEGEATYRYIFETWLPDSGFVLDTRPHFAVMGEKYHNDDPSSEEELWIPVRRPINSSSGRRG